MTKRKEKRVNKSRRERRPGKHLGKKELTTDILNLFRDKPGETLPMRYIFTQLRLNTHPLKALCREILDELTDLGCLHEPEKWCYELDASLINNLDSRRRAARRSLHTGGRRKPAGSGAEAAAIPYPDCIVKEFDLAAEYPAAAVNEAANIKPGITPQEIARREDFRSVPTFTIDPADAQDFDDALSFRPTDDGCWEVGVHIADVSHYVPEGGVIDREAQQRGTSVYLVGHVLPMLPEALCNYICSLRPGEEKLTFSVVCVLDAEANVRASRIVRTVIKSDRRFNYEEALRGIETGQGDFGPELQELSRLAQMLRKRRMDNGAIDFERAEAQFTLDEAGKPVGVYVKQASLANQLIEEFMLLANRTVAERGPLRGEQATANSQQRTAGKAKPKRTFVYRIHDLPDPEKLSHLAATTSHWGYKLQTTGSHTDVSRSINGLLSGVRGKPEQQLIETLSLRAMQKARYSVHNIGHYGLAFDHYTHFTSPIRRYPDLMVHRLLTRYAEPGARSVPTQKTEELCEHCSAMEQLAASAERASEKYMQAEFMKDKVGQVYDGVISSVAEWGFYVELDENKCEGLVPVRDLDDDYYVLDERNLCLRGRRHNRTYKLGDQVSVQVARVDMERRQLDFSLV